MLRNKHSKSERKMYSVVCISDFFFETQCSSSLLTKYWLLVIE